MAFFADLSAFEYAPQPELRGALNVGWLARGERFATGRTTAAFREKLRALCASPAIRHRGFHTCEFGLCRFVERWAARGNGVIVVEGRGKRYAAPTLIYHYVTRHRYLPPPEFIDAVTKP